MFVSFNACSDDDDEDDKKENLIVGKWSEKGTTTVLEFKSNGTFQYTETDDKDYEEHGKWKIESGDKLYMLFSDEHEWIGFKIHKIDAKGLIIEEFDENGLFGYTTDFNRIK